MDVWKRDRDTQIEYLGPIDGGDLGFTPYAPPDCQSTRVIGDNVTVGALVLPAGAAFLPLTFITPAAPECPAHWSTTQQYTIPLAGRYDIACFLTFTTPGGWLAASIELALFVNAAFFSTLDIDHLHAAGTGPSRPQLTLDGNDMPILSVGDNLTFEIRDLSGVGQTIAVWNARAMIHWQDDAVCSACLP